MSQVDVLLRQGQKRAWVVFECQVSMKENWFGRGYGFWYEGHLLDVLGMGKQSSIPPHKTRPDSPVRTLQRNCDPSQIWPRGSQERKHEFPASTRDEALFHCTEPSGVPRGPSQLHSIPDFSEAPLDLLEITGTSRGNQGFPAPTRKRPRESFFNVS